MCSGTSHRLHPQLSSNVCYAFFKVAMRMRAQFNQSLSQYKVITPQYAMMRILSMEDRMTQVELGSYLAMDKATMVRMLDNLEKLKYLRRVQSDRDRRAKWLELTPSGKKIMQSLEKIRAATEAKFLLPLNLQEQAQLRNVVGKLLVDY